MASTLKTTLLLGSLTGLLLLFGDLFGGRSGVQVAFVFAAIMNLGAYWFSDKIVLMTYRAQPIEESEAPELYEIIQQLTRRAGLPMPRVYLIDEDQPNAFATGRSPEHAAVAVSTGLLLAGWWRGRVSWKEIERPKSPCRMMRSSHLAYCT